MFLMMMPRGGLHDIRRHRTSSCSRPRERFSPYGLAVDAQAAVSVNPQTTTWRGVGRYISKATMGTVRGNQLKRKLVGSTPMNPASRGPLVSPSSSITASSLSSCASISVLTCSTIRSTSQRVWMAGAARIVVGDGCRSAHCRRDGWESSDDPNEDCRRILGE